MPTSLEDNCETTLIEQLRSWSDLNQYMVLHDGNLAVLIGDSCSFVVKRYKMPHDEYVVVSFHGGFAESVRSFKKLLRLMESRSDLHDRGNSN